jgi:hypothetical protein
MNCNATRKEIIVTDRVIAPIMSIEDLFLNLLILPLLSLSVVVPLLSESSMSLLT